MCKLVECITYIRSACWDITKGTLGGDGDQSLLQLLGADFGNSKGGILSRLEREKIGQETSDMWGGHGGTGDGVGGILASDPGGLDVQTRGKDIGALSEVGEVGTLIE